MFFCYLVAFLVVFIFTLPLLHWHLNLYKYRSLKHVPGPKPKFLTGNSDLLGSTPTSYLKGLMNLQNRYGNFYKLWTGPTLRLIVNKPEYLKDLLSSTVNLSKSDGYDLFKPWLGDGLLVTNANKWKARRKIITPTFHFKVLDGFMDVFNHQTNIMLDQIMKMVQRNPPGETVDIFKFINLMSLDSICETAFGTSIGAQHRKNPKYVAAVKAFLEIFVFRFYSGWLGHPLVFPFTKPYKIYHETLRILHEFCDDVIQRRKQEFQKEKTQGTSQLPESGIRVKSALLDMLLQATNENGEPLTDRQIRDEVNTFMFEGHDTSATAACFALYALAQNPKHQAKMYEELCEVLGTDPKIEITTSQINDLHYSDRVIKEALRIYQPVPLIERKIEEEWIIDEAIKVPKNTTVAIFLYGMSHDPNVFSEPEKFNPDRFLAEQIRERHNFAYVPFSAGPRNCIGQRYAMMSLKVMLAKFLLEFRVEEDRNFAIDLGTCSVLKSMNGYKMKIFPRKY
ncbi:hypothetical protein ABEB36_001803 [Hypothenemus hampei]|uniref:Cytochrome P450 n=1 Tax=Hypothenemus hampei TaxID=57062 RepID=A0ABD1FGF4_HYPHA